MQMSIWSTKLASSALFLCICVETVEVAVFFRQFTGASMNALMDPSSRPSFPAQLGCQGFVVIDAGGRFITTKSAVYLDLGDAAFLDIEQKLINAGQSQSSTQFSDATVFQPSSTARESSSSESRATELSELDSLPSVGYEDMDAEHEINSKRAKPRPGGWRAEPLPANRWAGWRISERVNFCTAPCPSIHKATLIL